MARLMLSAEQWSKLKEIVLQHQIYNKPNLRMTVEVKFIEALNPDWRDLYEDICR